MGNTPQAPNSQKPVLERLSDLEKVAADLYQAIDATFAQLREHVTVVMQNVEGVIGTMAEADAEFPNKVDAFMTKKRVERLQKKVDNQKKEIEFLVANNELKVADVVGPDSVLVGRMFDTEGKVVGVGYDQAPFAQFTKEAQESLLGKGVGFMFESGAKTKFEVLAVYDPVPKAQPATASVAPVVTPPVPATTPTVVDSSSTVQA